MGMTIAEKVLYSHSGSDCRAGEMVIAGVDLCMAQDGTSTMMIRDLEALGFSSPKTKRGLRLVIDHNSPCPSADVARMHKVIRTFANRNGLPVHEVGEGVCHQVIPESGKVMPGDLVVGADSHTCTYGALNACSTGMGSADVAAAAFTGKLWFRVPETFRMDITGSLPPRVSAKDVVLTVSGAVKADGATYKSIEFTGDVIDSLQMDGRMTIANMAVEMGAKFSPFQFDSITREWYAQRGLECGGGVTADKDAAYEREMAFVGDDIVPKVASPHRVDNVMDVEDVASVELDQVFIGACTNGRLSDLEAAVRVMGGRPVSKGVRMIVAPASREGFLKADELGLISKLVRSGAVLVPPGCGPCVGTHAGVPSDGETVLSTANRNFMGRMGNNRDVKIYLASPETAAASAVKGVISDPREV